MAARETPPPERALAALGFTDTEAAIYCELLRGSPSTGYRLAQSIGKAPANVYQALAALAQKGAVLIDDREGKSYRATPPAELLTMLEHDFQARRSEAGAALERLHTFAVDDRLYQLSTVSQVYERATGMIEAAQELILFDLFPAPFERLRDDLERAAARGVTVAGVVYETSTTASFATVMATSADLVQSRWPGLQIGIVSDAREHLRALLSHDAARVKHGVWSDSLYLACLAHSDLAAEILIANAPQSVTADAVGRLGVLRDYPPGLREMLLPPPAAKTPSARRRSGGKPAKSA